MKKKFVCALILFTVFVCTLFVMYNPTIASDFGNETFHEGEVFTPENGVYDFKVVKLKSDNTTNYTARKISSGHYLLYDNTGDRSINIIEYDKMIHSQKDEIDNFLHGELEKPGWTVDGVEVHEIDFIRYDELYAAYLKDSSNDFAVYVATPDGQDTAGIINSITFRA